MLSYQSQSQEPHQNKAPNKTQNETPLGDSAETYADFFPLISMGAQAQVLGCADQEARAPIGVSKKFGPSEVSVTSGEATILVN